MVGGVLKVSPGKDRVWGVQRGLVAQRSDRVEGPVQIGKGIVQLKSDETVAGVSWCAASATDGRVAI